MLKNGRIYIYLLIASLITLLNFLFELDQNSLEEALYETIIVFPLTLSLTFLVYKIRAYIYRNKILNTCANNSFNIKLIIAIIIIIKTFVLAVIIKYITHIAFNDEQNDIIFFDLIFWAISIALLFNILYIYQYEHFLLISEKKHQAELEVTKHQKEIFTSKYHSIKKQLNPHFLFNSFNSLSALIDIDSKKADSFLQGLSDVYRYNLDHSEEIVITLEKELELIKKYMNLQKIRFNNSLQIFYSIDSDKLNYLLPPMTLELLVENAIKHNIIEKTRPLKIKITTEGNYVIVENNYQQRGDSLTKADSLGIGLKNLKNQYELIYTEVPSFKIKDDIFQVIVPLIEPSI